MVRESIPRFFWIHNREVERIGSVGKPEEQECRQAQKTTRQKHTGKPKKPQVKSPRKTRGCFIGADDGNRTRVAGLGSRNAAIVPHPRIGARFFKLRSAFFRYQVYRKTADNASNTAVLTRLQNMVLKII